MTHKMWGDYPGYYSKYVIRQKRARTATERRDRREQEQKNAARFMRKIRAQIRLGDQLETREIKAWTALSDVNYRVAEFFASDRLFPEDEVSLILEAKDTIYLRAKVIRCHEYESTHRVIAPIKYKYRVRLAFNCDSPAEQTLFQDYLASAAA